MPSTITIMPAIKIMVAQLIPLELSSACPAVCQNDDVKMLFKFNVCVMAEKLCMHTPKTMTSVARAQSSVTTWRSSFSEITRPNMSTNIVTAKI